MKGGDWIWILVVAFGLLRLLMLARKKKAAEENRPPIEPRPGVQHERRTAPAPRRDDPLKSFIDSLTDRYERNIMPVEVIPTEPEEFETPPPRLRRPPAAKKTRPAKEQEETAPVIKSRAPVEQEIGYHFNFSRNPVIQGIIFSEIIGPPRGMAGESRLPSDPPA